MASTINASSTGSGGLISSGDASGQLALQANGTTVATVSSTGLAMATGQTINTNNTYGFKNRIINGGMTIDQRNAGASVTAGTGNPYTVDRWVSRSSQNSKYTVQQNAGSVTPPTGFTYYLGITSSSAYTVGSAEQFLFRQQIEGYNFADLRWGTANAATVTLSFWVRSSLTGTFGGALYNNDGSRSYPFSYTINSANTWEYKTITILGDTSGTWQTTNSTGVSVGFGLGVGSTLSGTAGAWASAYYASATGATSVVGTNGATFYITGVQLEVGSQATSFDFRSIGTELALCQRYFEKNFPQTVAPVQGSSNQTYGGGLNSYNSTNSRTPRIRFAVVKRTAPSITFYRPAVGQGGTVDGQFSYYNPALGWLTSTNTTVIDSATQDNEWGADLATAGAYTAGQSYLWGGQWTASAEL